jgi:hypothetical protein
MNRKWKGPMQELEDKMFDIYNDVFDRRGALRFPMRCVDTDTKSLHVFVYRHKPQHPRAGIWVWCSESRTFVHFSGNAPNWWKNLDLEIDMGIDSLEDNHQSIDTHLNMLLSESA